MMINKRLALVGASLGRYSGLFLVLFCTFSTALAQPFAGDYRSAGVGPVAWNLASSWERFDGAVWVNPAPASPTSADGTITIQAGHTINVTATVAVDQVVIDGTLTVAANAGLTVSGSSGITVNNGGILDKAGTSNTLNLITGTTTGNTFFDDGATYIHSYTTVSGAPPTATWHANSNFRIVGYTGTRTISGASWSQTFGNVEYNCPNQGNGSVNFAGLLTTIAGNLVVNATTATGTGTVRFNDVGTGTSTAITGDFTIAGPSRVWLTSTGSHTVNVGGAFTFNPTITGTSQLSSTGTGTLNIDGAATFSANNFTLTSATTGVGNLTVNNNNSLTLGGGTMILGGGAATGTVTLNGGDFIYSAGNLTIAGSGSSSIVLNQGTGTGNFTMTSTGTLNFANGTLGVGQITLNGGNFSSSAGTITETSSGNGTFNFTGAGTSSFSVATSPLNAINYNINKPSGSVQLLSNLTVGTAATLTVTTGSLDLNGNTLTINGNIAPNDWTAASASLATSAASTLIIGGTTATLPTTDFAFPGANFTTLTLTRTGGGSFNFSSSFSATALNLTTATVNYTTGTATVGTFAQTSGTVNNSGTFNITTHTQTNGTFTNNGTTSVTTHTQTNGAYNNNGTRTVGTHTQTAGTFTNGATGTVTVTNLLLNGGTFANNNVLNIADLGAITRLNGALTGNAITPLGVYDLSYTNTGAIATGLELTASATALRNFSKPSGNATVTLSSAATINGNLSISTGTVAGSTFAIDLRGDFSGVGTFTHAASATFTFLNPNATHSFTGSGTCTFGNLVVNGAVTAGNTKSFTIATSLTVNDQSSLTVTPSTAASPLVTFNFTGGGTIPVVLNGSGAVSFNAVTINGGGTPTTLLAPAGTMAIAGNFTTTGVFSANGGTVLFNGTSNLSAAETYQDITVTGTVTSTGNVSQGIGGSMVNNGSFSLGTGNLFWNGSGTLSGSGNVTIGDLTVAGPSFTYTGSGNVNLSDDLTGTGSVDASGGSGTFIFSGAGSAIASTGTNAFNNVSVTGTLTPASGIDFSIDGNLTVSGTLVAGAGQAITTFGNGGASTTSTISGAGTIGFDDLTIASGHTLTSSPGTITLSGDFTNNQSFVHNAGTVQFVTGGTKNIAGNSTTFNNLTVGNGTGNTTVTNALAPLNLAGRLNINSAVANTFNTGGAANFILLSDTDGPSGINGSIGPIPSPAVLSGAMTVQRFVSSEGRVYRYISSPVVGATVADWQDDFFVTGSFTNAHNGSTPGCTGCTTNPSSYLYDPSVPNFVAYPTPSTGSSTDVLVNGRGYSVYFRHDLTGNVTLDYPGTHPSTAGLTLTPLLATATNGFALIGNPYPSNILWSNAGFTKVNVSDIISVRDNPGGGIFRTLDINDGTGIVATGQAFWVETTGGSPSLVINENAKTASQGTFYHDTAPLLDEITVYLKKNTNNLTNGLVDEAKIRLKDGTSDLYDVNRDATNANNQVATKSTNGSETNVNVEVHDLAILSSDASPLQLALQSIGSVGCSQTFKLHLKNLLNLAYPSLGIAAETSVTYDFSINPTGAFKAMEWSLYDAVTNTTTNLSTTPVYSFTITSNAELANRFTLTTSGVSINQSLAVTSAAAVCLGSDASVTIANSQAGMTYAAEVNGVLEPFTEQGNGGNLSLLIPAERLSAANTIRIKANAGCTQQFLATTLEISTEELITAQANAVSRCSPGSVTLTATGAPSPTAYRWYENPDGGSSIGVGETFETVSLSDTVIFYVAAVNAAGCEGTRVPVMAAISNTSGELQVASAEGSICFGQGKLLTATGAPEGGSYKWYESMAASVPLASSAEINTAPLFKNTRFYVAAVSASGCEGSRVEHLVTVDSPPLLSLMAELETTCAGGNYTLNVSGAMEGSTYRWFATEESSTPLGEGSEFAAGVLTTSTAFYVSAISPLGCESQRKQIVVEPVSASEFGSDVTVAQVNKACEGGEVQFKAAGVSAGHLILWYHTATDPVPFGEGQTFTTQNAGNKIYYSVLSDAGCESIRKELTIESETDVMLSVTAVAHANCETGNYVLSVTGAQPDSEYTWYSSDNRSEALGTGADFTTPVLTNISEFYVAAVSPLGCESSLKSVSLSPISPQDPSLNLVGVQVDQVCAEGEARLQINELPAGFTARWYETATSTTALGEGAEFHASLNESVNAYYFAAVSSQGCEGSRVAVPVSVTTIEPARIDRNDLVLTSNYATGVTWLLDGEVISHEQTIQVENPGVYELLVNAEGCSTSDTIDLTHVITGVEGGLARLVTTFPNPARHQLFLRNNLKSDVGVTIVDMQGRSLLSMSLGAGKTHSVDVKETPAGIYLVRIVHEKEVSFKKVIIQ